MNSPAKPALSPVVIAGLGWAIRGLRVLFAVAQIIPAGDRILFLSRQSNEPSADIAALTTHLHSESPRARIVVMARKMRSNRDLGYGFHLIRQVWHLAHATTVVLDSYSLLTSNKVVRRDARVIQMWHALGSFKRFGWDDVDPSNPRRVQLSKALNMHAGNTVVVASSDTSANNFASAFAVARDRVAVSPLPRVDRIVDAATRENVAEAIRRNPGSLDVDGRLLLVAPTIHSPLSTDSTIDDIASASAGHGFTTVASHHPVTHRSTAGWSTSDLLTVADAFVTDKSSMIYEAGLLGIPGFLWAPKADQEALFAESYPSADELRELIVESVDDLFAALSDDTRRGAAARFAARYIDIDPNQSATERLARIISNS